MNPSFAGRVFSFILSKLAFDKLLGRAVSRAAAISVHGRVALVESPDEHFCIFGLQGEVGFMADAAMPASAVGADIEEPLVAGRAAAQVEEHILVVSSAVGYAIDAY